MNGHIAARDAANLGRLARIVFNAAPAPHCVWCSAVQVFTRRAFVRKKDAYRHFEKAMK